MNTVVIHNIILNNALFLTPFFNQISSFSPPNPKERVDFFKPMKKHDRFTPRKFIFHYSLIQIFSRLWLIFFNHDVNHCIWICKERLPFFDILRQMSLSKERWMHDVMFWWWFNFNGMSSACHYLKRPRFIRRNEHKWSK